MRTAPRSSGWRPRWRRGCCPPTTSAPPSAHGPLATFGQAACVPTCTAGSPRAGPAHPATQCSSNQPSLFLTSWSWSALKGLRLVCWVRTEKRSIEQRCPWRARRFELCPTFTMISKCEQGDQCRLAHGVLDLRCGPRIMPSCRAGLLQQSAMPGHVLSAHLDMDGTLTRPARRPASAGCRRAAARRNERAWGPACEMPSKLLPLRVSPGRSVQLRRPHDSFLSPASLWSLLQSIRRRTDRCSPCRKRHGG